MNAQQPSAIERETAIVQLRQSAAIQMERIQVYLDGATLGAEQVQDKRLEILENGPEVSASSLFIDVVMTVLLESTIAGKILVKTTQTIFRSVLKANAVFHVLTAVEGASGDRLGRLLTRDRTSLASFLQWLRRSARTQLAREFANVDPRQVNTYRRYIASLARSVPSQEENLLAAAQGAWAYASGRNGEKPPRLPEPTDSPGVALRAHAQQSASEHRLAIMLTQATLEGAVRSEMLTGEDVPLLLELLQWEPLPLDYGELRDHYKLVFEAMIWVKIYGLDVPNLQGSGRLGNAPEGLTNYWLRRFEGPITRWVATSPRGIDPILKNFRDQPRLKQISDLHQWFLRLGQLVPQAEEVFRSVERDHQQ